jgi:hypothetical protein
MNGEQRRILAAELYAIAINIGNEDIAAPPQRLP